MRRFPTAPLAACAIALIAPRASADESAAPKSEQSAPAQTQTSTTVQTTIVIAAPVVSTGHFLPDLFFNLFALGAQAAAIHAIEEQHRAEAPPPVADRHEPLQQYAPQYPNPYSRKHDAREGFLFSFGIGGGQMRLSGEGKTGAVDLGLRMGYGFSDRFQLFGDITADAGQFSSQADLTSWMLTLRGQTVLIGDRDGNGLNLNLGVGLGGITRNFHDVYAEVSSPAGIALVGGLSYDARVGQQFALSPELYYSWHLVPNGPGFESDNLYTVGLRLNFLWYAP
jgi:hypothetical protein